MKSRLVTLAVLAGIFTYPVDAGTIVAPLDLTGVTEIRISGDASSVRLTTDSTEKYEAKVQSHKTGWLSGWYSIWFFNTCRNDSRIKLDGAILYIEVPESSWMDVSDCTVEITGNMAPGKSVTIDQKALRASLEGDFSTVKIDSKAGDISLEGHASSVDLTSEALRARLVFDRPLSDETVRINARALDVYLGIGSQAPVNYTVTAKASYVDSAIKSTPDAKPSMTIRGDYVRATIR